jgi:HAD superfamily hydrolase (TIGR01509 family)
MIVPEALLFDMDGTLTEPLLDFAKIRREIGLTSDAILEQVARMDATERERAEAILHRHELEAAASSTLNPGCRQVLSAAKSRKVPVGVITRNSRQCTSLVMQKHGLEFAIVLTRDDGLFKPSPEPVLEACKRLNASATQAWMIGDGEFDVLAGRNAGAWTVWVSHGRERAFDAQADRVVRDLHELHDLLLSAWADETA